MLPYSRSHSLRSGVTARQAFLPLTVTKETLRGSNVTVIKAANVLRPQLKVRRRHDVSPAC